jgi:choline-sulfatase
VRKRLLVTIAVLIAVCVAGIARRSIWLSADHALADEARAVADVPPTTEVTTSSVVDADSFVPTKLNVVLITIDTLRADAVGFMGYSRPTTPNLDVLAARSVVFERAYSLASYTGKSLGPMLIGKYPSETRRDGNHFTIYAPSNVFVTERLHDAGLRTFGAAAHWYFQSWSGLSQGMDVWDTSARLDGSDTAITSAALSNEAIKLLGNAENTKGQFFAWFHYFDPHNKYMPHEGAPDMLGDAKGGAAYARALYDGEVWFTDKHIGRVLDFIALQPWVDRTAIIVTSDHGEAFGEHDMSWHGLELWEPLVRVPLLVYVPHMAPHRVPAKRSLIDIAPTICELADIAVPTEELSGKTLAPDVRGQGPYEEHDVMFDMPPSPYTAMRRGWITGETKLVDLGAHVFRLYDLTADPNEYENLASDRERLRSAVVQFERAWSGIKSFEVPPAPP